jgi:hypothetical protein
VAPDAAGASGSPPAAVKGAASSSWGAASATRAVASGSGPPGLDPSGAGGDGALAGAVADSPAEEDGANWGPGPPAGESPAGAVGTSGKRALAHINGVRTQKLNGTKKSFRRLLTRSQATPNLPE